MLSFVLRFGGTDSGRVARFVRGAIAPNSFKGPVREWERWVA